MDNGRGGQGPHIGEDAADGLAQLYVSLHAGCVDLDEWPAKVAAGVYAAIRFAASDRERALRLLAPAGDGRETGMSLTVRSLNDLLARTVTAGAEPGPGGRGPVQGVAMIVSDHLRSGRSDELAEIGPALVQFVLQPYLGYAEAKRWADRCEAGAGAP